MARILLIGQDSPTRNGFMRELRLQGHQIALALDISSPLEAIETTRPDMVILDIDDHPSLGLEILEAVRYRHYNLPVILLSAHARHLRDPRTMVADFLCLKPVDPGELMGKIVMALEANAPMSLGVPA